MAIAAPQVIEKHGTLPDAGDLAQYPLLHGDELDWANWSTGDTRSMSALRGAFIDDSSSLLSAVLEGLGFGLLRWTLAATEVQAGRVVLASEHIVPHRFAYYFGSARNPMRAFPRWPHFATGCCSKAGNSAHLLSRPRPDAQARATGPVTIAIGV